MPGEVQQQCPACSGSGIRYVPADADPRVGVLGLERLPDGSYIGECLRCAGEGWVEAGGRATWRHRIVRWLSV